MRRIELLAFLGLTAVPVSAWAQGTPGLTCRDAIEEISRKVPDAYALAVMAGAVWDTFKNLDATRIGSGNESTIENWAPQARAGEEMAVLLSCRAYPADTLQKRATGVFNEYVARHQP